ncbi:MAG: hypothetical protein MUD17_09360 [Gemmatimonadaceae bacterium]|nr:hypothetical protein [Gemmatimonadaceae bacterium]
MSDDPLEFNTGDDEHESRPAVFVTTREPVALTVAPLDDPRAPESSALASYIGGRLVARSAMPREAIDRLIALKLFEAPLPIGLFAYEESPGLQCRLFALVPREKLEEAQHADEPWKASVPSYEAGATSDEDEPSEASPYETILLGHIVRFASDRQHPDDLAAEAVDILQKILTGGDALKDADARAIDDLLDSL